MKKMIVALICLILTTSMVFAKSNTSFKIGQPYSTAQILLGDRNVQGKNFTPTLGLSFFSISISRIYTEDGESNESDMAARFLVPRIGARVLGNRVNDLNSYYFGEVFIVLPFISGSDLSNDDIDEIKDATDLIGITLGSGVEYFFSESFSLGGELAFNMVIHSMTNEYEDEWDGSSYKSEYNTRIGATLTQITLNYYFK